MAEEPAIFLTWPRAGKKKQYRKNMYSAEPQTNMDLGRFAPEKKFTQ